jgi:hypothetical protein
MDEKLALKRFRRQKIITVAQLVKLLTCSVITARRRLKKWKTYTSINQNGRYYTLPQIPVFDDNGLWRYRTVLFSKYGNLTQTIVAMIGASTKGLSAIQIADILNLAPNSSFISRFKNVPGVKREKHQGRFVYFSDQPEIYNRQKDLWFETEDTADFPTDAQGIIILVQLIKHPSVSIDQLTQQVSRKDKPIDSDSVRRFLQLHGLLKKIADTMR